MHRFLPNNAIFTGGNAQYNLNFWSLDSISLTIISPPPGGVPNIFGDFSDLANIIDKFIEQDN